MKLRCLLTGHRWHEMPWLRERRQPGKYWQKPGPKKACLTCGKLKYDYVWFIPSAEASFGPKFEYEGQWLRTHDSYEEWLASWERGKEELLRRLK